MFSYRFFFFTYSFLFNSQTQPQVQVQDEEITEDDLRLIQERESSIRQLEVSFTLQNWIAVLFLVSLSSRCLDDAGREVKKEN